MSEFSYKISVIVPMYFEQEVAQEFHRRIDATLNGNYDYEIIYVDDGSKDDTLKILKDIKKTDKHVKILSFSRNFGHQAAVTAGVDKAKGDAVVIIDADLQDPPELIPDMINMWQQGNDVVYAKRKKRKGESAFKLFTAKMFYKILRGLTSTDIPADTGDFRLMDRKVVEAFKKMSEHNRFIRGMVPWLGFKQVPIEYERDVRFAGVTKYPFRKMVKFAIDGIMSFSTKPLQLVFQLGVLAILISLGILIYALVIKIMGKADLEGWTSLVVIITFFGGVQLLSVGVLGQYIGRIYEEVQSRPIYLVDEDIDGEDE